MCTILNLSSSNFWINQPNLAGMNFIQTMKISNYFLINWLFGSVISLKLSDLKFRNKKYRVLCIRTYKVYRINQKLSIYSNKTNYLYSHVEYYSMSDSPIFGKGQRRYPLGRMLTWSKKNLVWFQIKWKLVITIKF